MIKHLRLPALLLAGATITATGRTEEANFQSMTNTHDLDLPAWGPFSKNMRASRTFPTCRPDCDSMSRCYGLYRGRVLIPNVQF